jgi:hypothetical protein
MYFCDTFFSIMLKLLAILIVLTAGLVAHTQIPRNGGQQKEAQTTDSQGQSANQPCLCNIQVQEGSPKQAQEPQAKPYQWRELYTPANIPNWVLAALAGWAGFMALRTLGAIKDQTKVAKDAADAALLSAQVVINAERGRIVLKIEKHGLPGEPGKAAFAVVALNKGRTPVKVTTFGIPTEIATAHPKKLPIPPVYPEGPETDYGSYLAVDSPGHEVFRFKPASHENMARRLASQQKEGGDFKDQRILAYGEIRYCDGISPEERYCRYCLSFDNSQFSNIGGIVIADGPPEYNDGT